MEMLKKQYNNEINAAILINELGYLKSPAECFASIIYNRHPILHDQIVDHSNTGSLIKILNSIRETEQNKLLNYLRIIIPIKYTLNPLKISKHTEHDWEPLLIEYNIFNSLYKIDKKLNKAKIFKIKKKLEETYSCQWQTSLARIIKWPNTDAPLGLDDFFPDGWQATGLLSKYRYTVGKKGLSEEKRQKILSNLVEKKLENSDFTRAYLSSWGKENSLDRLLKIARTIAVLCRNAKGSSNDFKQAIEDWESDLLFLKDKYFYNFLNIDNKKWPTT